MKRICVTPRTSPLCLPRSFTTGPQQTIKPVQRFIPSMGIIMTSSLGNFTGARNDTEQAIKNALLIRRTNVIAGFLYIAISFVGLTGSLLCLLAIFTRCHRSRVNALASVQPIFLSLSTSSLIFSVICAFEAYSTLSGRPNYLALPAYDPLCQIVGFTYYMISFVDQLQHATLALHRFFAIVVGDRFPWFRSRACTWILVAMPWMTTSVIFVLPFFHLGVEYGYNTLLDRCFLTRVNSWKFTEFNKLFFILFSLVTILVCYTAMAVKLTIARHQAARVGLPSSTGGEHSGHSRAAVNAPSQPPTRVSRSSSVTMTVFALCLLFLVSFLPWMIYPLVAKTDIALNTPTGITVVTLFLFGCAVNPWLIVLLTPALRKHVAGQLCRNGSAASV